jgi:rhodanese-related sulfurtransferase
VHRCDVSTDEIKGKIYGFNRMKKKIGRWSLALWTLSLFAMGCQAQQGSNQEPKVVATEATGNQEVLKQIDVAGAEQLMASQPDLQVLDVRTPEEVAQGILTGAKVINLFDSDFAQKAVAILDKSHPILVYCKAGGRSSRAAQTLKENGFTSIYNLEGGITEWMAEGKPVQK